MPNIHANSRSFPLSLAPASAQVKSVAAPPDEPFTLHIERASRIETAASGAPPPEPEETPARPAEAASDGRATDKAAEPPPFQDEQTGDSDAAPSKETPPTVAEESDSDPDVEQDAVEISAEAAVAPDAKTPDDVDAGGRKSAGNDSASEQQEGSSHRASAPSGKDGTEQTAKAAPVNAEGANVEQSPAASKKVDVASSSTVNGVGDRDESAEHSQGPGTTEKGAAESYEEELPLPVSGKPSDEPPKSEAANAKEAALQEQVAATDGKSQPDGNAGRRDRKTGAQRSNHSGPVPATEPKDADAVANTEQPTAAARPPTADAIPVANAETAAVASDQGESPADNRDAAPPRTPGVESRSSPVQREPSAPAPAATDRSRFVQRVAAAVHSAQERGGEVRLRLSPPELGSLRIEVSVEKGVLLARLEAESPAARTILLDNLNQLRDRLAEQEIKVGRFDVDLMEQPTDDAGRQTSDSRRDGRQERANRTNGSAADRPTESNDNTSEPIHPRVAASVQFDVVV